MRCTDWSAKFGAYISSRRAMPFAWGTNDCCFFAAEWVYACRGVDPAAEFRNTYGSPLEAARLLTELGGLTAVADRVLERHTSPMYARVGDIMLMENAGRDMLVICNGNTALGPGERGIVNLPLMTAKLAWEV